MEKRKAPGREIINKAQEVPHFFNNGRHKICRSSGKEVTVTPSIVFRFLKPGEFKSRSFVRKALMC